MPGSASSPSAVLNFKCHEPRKQGCWVKLSYHGLYDGQAARDGMQRRDVVGTDACEHAKAEIDHDVREFRTVFHNEARERHCQTNLNGPAKGAGLRRSGRQLTPLGQGGRTVLFEDIAAVEVAVVVEVVVD